MLLLESRRSNMWSFSLQRLCDQQVQVNSAWLYFKASLLISCSWHITWMIIFTWRTSSSSSQIWDQSQNVHKRKVLHHFNIQIKWQLCFTCLKGQQRFYLLNKSKRIIYSSQLASLPRSFENQRQDSDPGTFSERYHKLSNFLNFMSCHLIEEVSSIYPLQTAFLGEKAKKNHLQLTTSLSYTLLCYWSWRTSWRSFWEQSDKFTFLQQL